MLTTVSDLAPDERDRLLAALQAVERRLGVAASDPHHVAVFRAIRGEEPLQLGEALRLRERIEALTTSTQTDRPLRYFTVALVDDLVALSGALDPLTIKVLLQLFGVITAVAAARPSLGLSDDLAEHAVTQLGACLHAGEQVRDPELGEPPEWTLATLTARADRLADAQEQSALTDAYARLGVRDAEGYSSSGRQAKPSPPRQSKPPRYVAVPKTAWALAWLGTVVMVVGMFLPWAELGPAEASWMEVFEKNWEQAERKKLKSILTVICLGLVALATAWASWEAATTTAAAERAGPTEKLGRTFVSWTDNAWTVLGGLAWLLWAASSLGRLDRVGTGLYAVGVGAAMLGACRFLVRRD